MALLQHKSFQFTPALNVLCVTAIAVFVGHLSKGLLGVITPAVCACVCVEALPVAPLLPKSTTLLTGAREKEAGRVRERQGERAV